jgi:hypothetical protein
MKEVSTELRTKKFASRSRFFPFFQTLQVRPIMSKNVGKNWILRLIF